MIMTVIARRVFVKSDVVCDHDIADSDDNDNNKPITLAIIKTMTFMVMLTVTIM